MTTNSQPSPYARKSAGWLLVIGVLLGVTVGSPVSASASTKVTWNVSSLTAGEVRILSTLVSTISPGVKIWSESGTCTLVPRSKPTKLTMGVTGSCELTLKIAQTGVYPAKTSKKIITLVAADATVTLTCATGGTCAVGDTGPGGGTVFYVASSRFTSIGSACGTVCKYLEAAPVGWITAPSPAGQTNCVFQYPYPTDPACEWSGNTQTAIGSTRKRIGTGYANTSAIISQRNGGNAAGNAATVARTFRGGGKTDWSLPSKAELNALCKWARNDTVTTSCNDQRYFRDGITPNGGFITESYWSSSEFHYSRAWSQSFTSNTQTQGSSTKRYPRFVRPVRAF